MLAQVLLQLRQRVVHGGVQEAVDDRRGSAHVLALAPGQLMAEQHRDRPELVRRVLGQEDLLDSEFVHRVLDRVGEADHQRLGTRVDEFPQGPPDVLAVKLQQDGAAEVHALADRADQGLRHERVGPGTAGHVVLGQLVQALAVAPAARQRDRGLEPGGDDGPHLGSAPLDQRVRAQSGRVPYRVNLSQHVVAPQAQGEAGVIERLVEAQGQVVVGGERLGLDVAAVPRYEAVGEGAADVNGYAFHAGFPPSTRSGSAGTSRPSGITVLDGRAAHCAWSASTSISMSYVGGWPGGRYSVSIWVPQPGQ